MPAQPTDDLSAAPTLVACLCAAWCRVCEGYREVFAALRKEHPDWRFVWLDIEDEAELVGELEVETFPTLLIAQGRQLRFVGPVLPQLAPARRLLQALQTTDAPPPGGADPAAQALLRRLQHDGGD